ncbi:hypothetical protein EGR_02289 [Echinococcus granulosus]|uniref:Uncharacterized protein n=1 Tax=Echinococcus granulosus TaxID=6210 RepID=W6UNN6_ECHGR|nr:hypothetical protein EGR_02289 [Echinococcus granulosus]EUB62848.1 hypothetical protein EGR_02289 [Echinococcus granulosus]
MILAQRDESGAADPMARDQELIFNIIAAYFLVLGVVAVPQVIAALMAVAAVAMVWGGVAAVMTIAVVADVVPMEEDVFAVPAVHLAAVVVQAADVVVASKWDAALVSTTADEPVVVAATFRCWQMMNITATYNTSTAVDVSKQINSRILSMSFFV